MDGQGNGVLDEGWEGIDGEEGGVRGSRRGRRAQEVEQEVDTGREICGKWEDSLIESQVLAVYSC